MLLSKCSTWYLRSFTLWFSKPCGLGLHFPMIIITSDFFLFLVHAAYHLHKWSQRSGYACGTFMSQVSSSLCGAYPTLSPSSLVPYAFVPARVRRCHAFHHSGGFSIRSSCLQSLTLQYLQRNYHVVKNASLVLALGYFNEAFKHVSGGTGWSVTIAQVLHKLLYVFDLDIEHWYWWYPTLQQYQHCEGMTEEHVCLPTLQDKTTIVGTREEVWVVYPTLETLSKRSP